MKNNDPNNDVFDYWQDGPNVSLQYIKYIVTQLLLAKKLDDDGTIMDIEIDWEYVYSFSVASIS